MHVPPTVGRVALLPSPTARTVVVRLLSYHSSPAHYPAPSRPRRRRPRPDSPPALRRHPLLTDTATAAPTALAMYQVRRGTTVGVAQKHGVELQTLLALNPRSTPRPRSTSAEHPGPVAQAVTAPTDPRAGGHPEPTAPPEPTETPAPTTTRAHRDAGPDGNAYSDLVQRAGLLLPGESRFGDGYRHAL